jgi:hypothetical protein
MKDADFKALNHPTSGDFVVTCGTEVSPGYKPDIIVRDASSKLRFILECEQKTDRKAFLGDLLKAEIYADQQGARPTLIIVMKPHRNTTTRQIADHLKPYIAWLALKNGGQLNLTNVHVLSDSEYLQAIRSNMCMGSSAFKKNGYVLTTTSQTLSRGDKLRKAAICISTRTLDN